MTPDHYLHLLQALLPPGAAFTREDAADLTKVLLSLATELARLDTRGDALLAEDDPRTTAEMIAEWERAYGLPDPCTGPLATLAERRVALHTKVSATGGQSRAYFIALAAALGYTVTIDENVDGNQYKWRVNAPAVTVRNFLAGQSRAGDRLRTWGNTLLECAITRLCPAHTLVLFGYGG